MIKRVIKRKVRRTRNIIIFLLILAVIVFVFIKFDIFSLLQTAFGSPQMTPSYVSGGGLG